MSRGAWTLITVCTLQIKHENLTTTTKASFDQITANKHDQITKRYINETVSDKRKLVSGSE